MKLNFRSTNWSSFSRVDKKRKKNDAPLSPKNKLEIPIQSNVAFLPFYYSVAEKKNHFAQSIHIQSSLLSLTKSNKKNVEPRGIWRWKEHMEKIRRGKRSRKGRLKLTNGKKKKRKIKQTGPSLLFRWRRRQFRSKTLLGHNQTSHARWIEAHSICKSARKCCFLSPRPKKKHFFLFTVPLTFKWMILSVLYSPVYMYSHSRLKWNISK